MRVGGIYAVKLHLYPRQAKLPPAEIATFATAISFKATLEGGEAAQFRLTEDDAAPEVQGPLGQ